MTAPDDDLTAQEGVNQASADSTAESAESAETAGNTGALAAASQDGRPHGEYDPAPPLDTEAAESRWAKDAVGTGQEQQVGEG